MNVHRTDSGPFLLNAQYATRNTRSPSRHSSLVTRHSVAAFTLIEIMIAITILALIIAAIFASWTAIIRASRVGRDTAAAVQRARITIRIIEDSLGSAELFTKNAELYGFVAENGDDAILSFVARLAKSFPRSGKFGDLDVRRLEFTLQKGVGSSARDLVLRQRPLLMDFDQEEKDDPIILAKNVRGFEMRFYDRDKKPVGDTIDDWPDEWAQTNKLPALVAVTLRMGDNASLSSAEEVITRIVNIPAMAVRPDYQMPPMPGLQNPGAPPPGQLAPPGQVPNPNQLKMPAVRQ